MQDYCDRAAVSKSADYNQCAVRDKNRQYLPDTDTSAISFFSNTSWTSANARTMLPSPQSPSHKTLNTQPDTYPMHECLRVEKLPCIFLEKRESLFIILLTGSKRVELSSERHQNSSFGRRRINRVNFCGATKTSMLSRTEKESCPKRCLWSRVMSPGDRSPWQEKQVQEQQM